MIMEENRNIQPAHAGQEEDSGMSLLDMWHMVWDYKWWYVLSIAVCLVFGALYLYRTAPVYQRTAKLIIQENSQESALREISAFAGNLKGSAGGDNVNNEVEAFSSPDLMKTVVERLGLQTTYIEHQFLRDVELYTSTPVQMSVLEGTAQSSFSFELKKVKDSILVLDDFRVAGKELKSDHVVGRPGDTLSTPVGKLRLLPNMGFGGWDSKMTVAWNSSMAVAKSYSGRLSASVSGKQTSVIALGFQDRFPSRAENVLSTLIDVYNEEWVHDKNRSARNTTAFINERLVVIEQELGGIENSLKKFKEENKLTNMELASQAFINESTNYSAQSFEVSNQLAIANYIRDYLTDPAHSKDLLPANSGLSSSNIEKQIAEYNEIVLNRDRLLTSSSERNPLIADMNSSLNAMKATIIRSIDNHIATLQLQADKIKGQEDQVMSRIASSSGQELELLSIERQQKVKETLYIYLLQKREENEIAGLVNVGNTRLIMNPNGSGAPVSPNRMMILFAMIVLGCAIPFGILFLKRTMDTSVHSRNDLSGVNLPFLGEIPLLGTDRRRKGLARLVSPEKFDNTNCRIFVRPGSRDYVNEAFRVLRTNIDMMTGREAGCKVMMVTSMFPNSGKTFMLMNMAASMALKGSRVLMIDLDLRKATLSKALALNGTGVTSYLSGKTDSFMDHIRQVQEHLNLLPVGSLPPNPSELLLSDRFRSMTDTLKKEYDYIFIDCPPIDMVADTYIIAGVADISIYVVRAGVADKRNLYMLEQLRQDTRLKRLSLILNGVENYRRGYGKYGYGYGHYGNYGD